MLVAAAALAAAFGGCGGSDAGPGRILLVGIDSADWSVIDPLLSEGRMPNLASLMESGVSCELHSLVPKQKSPTIWTTIATGKAPDKHGIHDYVDPLSKKLITSNVRSARTFWDILGDTGRTVSVTGWLVSWPAEEINGFMVTDYFHHPPKPDRPLPEDLTFPRDFLEEVTPLRVVPDDITDEDADRFIDLDAVPPSEEIQSLPVEEMFLEMRGIQGLEKRVRDLKIILASDRTYLGAARYLITEHPTDVTVVYLRGVDSASHKFWADAHRGEVGFPVSTTETLVFGKAVERYYEYADEMLGELVELFGDGTVIVCSDHGFEGPKPGRLPGGINDHGPVGILVMAGDAFKVGARLPERSVRDITPTILAACGVPVGEDMDGAVIEDAFLPGYLRSHPVERIATHEVAGP